MLEIAVLPCENARAPYTVTPGVRLLIVNDAQGRASVAREIVEHGEKPATGAEETVVHVLSCMRRVYFC